MSMICEHGVMGICGACDAPAHGVAALLREQVITPADACDLLSAVDMAGADGATVPDDGCWRPEQVNPRGRWRTKKRALRQLAEDLNYPECMEVAHPEQIDGAVMQAGVRLRDFYKLHRVRTTPAQAKAERAQRRVDKREMARAIARGEPPF